MSLKNSIVLLAFFLIVCTSFAQKKLNLYFKDGSTKLGYVAFKANKLKISEKRKGKKESIDYVLLDSAVVYVKKRPNVTRRRKPKTYYFFGYNEKPKSYTVFDLVKKGKVSIYKLSNISGASGGGGGWIPGGASVGGNTGRIYVPKGKNKPTPYYVVKKDTETYVTGFKNDNVIWQNFKNQVMEYFHDCPKLLKKIEEKDKGFKKGNVKNIVKFYNESCK